MEFEFLFCLLWLQYVIIYYVHTQEAFFFFPVKNKTESQTREQTCGCQGGKGWRRDGGVEWELGVSRCKMLYVEYMKSQVLRYSTGNYIQCPVCVLVAQSCPTLCDPVDCSPPGSSVHEILQARILEWVAIPFYQGPSRPRDRTWVSCIAGRFFIA